MASAAAVAFDRIAAGYDEDFGRNPVGLLFRHVVQERLRRLFRPGMAVLDLGCGTGEDALFLAELGLRVLALDVARGMVERCQAKARERGLPDGRLRVEQRPAEELASLTERFDGAYSDFGALNCADLAEAGRGLAHVLRPGAPVLLGLMGRHPLPAMLERALTGRGTERGRSVPRVGGLPVPIRHATLWETRRLLAPHFLWRAAYALGVLVPGPEHGPWVTRHPQIFGVLAAAESVVRAWPLLRGLGDHLVLEGLRR